MRDALTDDGLVLQWIGHRPDTQYKLIMRTFLDVFPDDHVVADGQLLVGVKRPLRLARAPFEAKRANARPAPRSTRSVSTASRR